MKLSLKMRLFYSTSTILFLTLLEAASGVAQTAQVFRLDGGNSTYAFGVNEHGELQPLYWGGRLGAHDSIPPAHSFPEMASFDSPYTTTPQEYAGWGAGLFTEPALKVSFADGNRDLVLHFVRATQSGPQAVEVQLKDISREIYVTLRYSMDRGERNSRALRRHRKSGKAASRDRTGRCRAMDSASRALHLELFDGPLGRRVDPESGADSRRRARHRKPPRNHRPSSQSVVCDFP